MRATILPKAIILTKARRAAVSIMAKGYLSTASEMFLIFTTQLYSYMCNYNAIHVFPYTHIATAILPTPNTSLSSLPMGSKYTV